MDEEPDFWAWLFSLSLGELVLLAAFLFAAGMIYERIDNKRWPPIRKPSDFFGLMFIGLLGLGTLMVFSLFFLAVIAIPLWLLGVAFAFWKVVVLAVAIALFAVGLRQARKRDRVNQEAP